MGVTGIALKQRLQCNQIEITAFICVSLDKDNDKDKDNESIMMIKLSIEPYIILYRCHNFLTSCPSW